MQIYEQKLKINKYLKQNLIQNMIIFKFIGIKQN